MLEITTYPEMNAQIVSLLRIDTDSPLCLYAAKRIEELEEEQTQIVQCKDCIYAEVYPNGANTFCHKGTGIASAFGFCSYGEKRGVNEG